MIVFAAAALSLRLDAFLCDTPRHAMQYADAIAQGNPDEIAKDIVGRSAQAEVCGLYRGTASVESEQVVVNDGVAYKLTELRFAKDNRIAWLAEPTFAPTELAEDAHI